MIKTRCPHGQKLLGINDEAVGTIAVCPACKKKFRVPDAKAGAAAKTPASAAIKAPPSKPPNASAPEDEFPEVEVVEDAELNSTPVQKTPRKRRPARDVEEEAARDEDDVEVEKPARKKKKRKKKQDNSMMVLRNRIVGAVGALGGAAFIVVGVTKALPQGVFDNLGEQIWIAPTAFGGLLVLVGLFYLVKPE